MSSVSDNNYSVDKLIWFKKLTLIEQLSQYTYLNSKKTTIYTETLWVIHSYYPQLFLTDVRPLKTVQITSWSNYSQR